MSATEPTRSRATELEALLVSALLRQPRALARAVTVLESGGEDQRRLLERLYPRVGGARVTGITGPPGAGKSTLVDRVARGFRARGQTVGILAVDPTSPFSGGAILGDRVRMQAHYTDPGVFIRSMATRGAMGGVARSTRDAVDLLDAAGFDQVLVETVGVGQDEIDIVRTVDTVVVVTVPGLGDEIQAIKAGIMEIADIFVINKADRPGVSSTRRDLESMLSMADGLARRPPILETVAHRDTGIEDLITEIDRHGDWLRESGELAARRFLQLRLRVETILQERILAAADRALGLEHELQAAWKRGEDPYTVAYRLFAGAVEVGAREDR